MDLSGYPALSKQTPTSPRRDTMTLINIFRQYPAGSHNTPIRHLAERESHRVRTHEYDLDSNIGGVFGNTAFIMDALFRMRGEQFVLGAEPFDPRVLGFHRIAKRNDLVLHTSWPVWESEFVPQPPQFDWQRERWRKFLGDVHVVGVTQASVKAASEFGAREATHIPHSIDTSVYHPEAGTKVRDEPIVVFVGRLEPRKGVAELIDLIRGWDGPDARFWFVGNGPLAQEVSALADAREKVEYFGYVSDDEVLADIYASADILTLPSYRVEGWEELFGIVVIEALACGLPVVATDCVGPAEIVDDGETGYVVPQHDVDALGDSITNLLVSPDDRERMSERAREVAEERYENDKVADQWKRVLDI